MNKLLGLVPLLYVLQWKDTELGWLMMSLTCHMILFGKEKELAIPKEQEKIS